MRQLAAAFFRENPQLRFAALGSAANARALELSPFGVPAEFLAAERHPGLVRQYLMLNQAAFGTLPLSSWVLTDLYLLPGALGLLLGPAELLSPGLRERILAPDDATPVILAAYLGAPSVEPGTFVGVSLFSFLPARGAASWVKALSLRMLKARRLRGVAQSNNKSLRVHTRMGALRLLGPPPGAHELATHSFVYQTDLDDEAAWAESMRRGSAEVPTMRFRGEDSDALAALLRRAEAGESLWVVPPGLDAEGNVWVREGFLSGSSQG